MPSRMNLIEIMYQVSEHHEMTFAIRMVLVYVSARSHNGHGPTKENVADAKATCIVQDYTNRDGVGSRRLNYMATPGLSC